MFKRQRTGSVVCASCGSLVGVNDDKCYNCGRRNPGLWGFGPMLRAFGNDLGFVALVVYGCTTLYGLGLVLTVMMGGDVMGGGSPLSILSPDGRALFILGASGYEPVFTFGRWWTILSAGWLHAGVLHIFFNLLWIRQLGPATADIYGPGRMVIIYTIAGAAGFLLTALAAYFLWWMPIPFLRGSPLTVGASAPVFGLLGALVYYGRRGGSSMIRTEAMGYATAFFVMGFIIPGVDNYAHGGGFLGGYLASMWLDPLKPERMDHLVLAAICLGLTALSIVASVITALPLLGVG
ncbi:MAG TPA: rhomboid family intramembrane serine protease [Vicinamibacterales bacterium]|nr:rhomboid family intramembrane serine protease [Vicinamibacterales bacterium]